MNIRQRCVPICVVTAFLVGSNPAHAQVSRADWIERGLAATTTDSIFMAFIEAVRPDAGPVDGVWVRGIQSLAQAYFEESQIQRDARNFARADLLDSLAYAWMGWAVRFEPNFVADTAAVEFLEEVASAWRAARAVPPRPDDSLVETSWVWTGNGPFDGAGELRIAGFSLTQPLRVEIAGQGSLGAGERRRIPAGRYQIEASVGAETIRVTRSVLPGIVTQLSFEAFAQRITIASGVLPDAVRAAALAQVVRLDVTRLVGQSCATGVFVGSGGLLLTSYRAIRGAESVRARLANGSASDAVQVAGYDVGSDLAVLRVDPTRRDSLPISDPALDGQFAWSVAHADCLVSDASPTTVARWSRSIGDDLVLGDSTTGFEQSGPLLDGTGAVLGVISAARRAVPSARARLLLQAARRNVQTNALLPVDSVARLERHAYGSMDLSYSVANALGRVSPLESWQWPETARTDSLPFRFSGPAGRYRIDVLIAGSVADRSEFVINPGVFDQLALVAESVQRVADAGGGGGFPVPVAVVGVLGAAGAAVAVLAGGGGGGGPGGGGEPLPTTGGISINIPIP